MQRNPEPGGDGGPEGSMEAPGDISGPFPGFLSQEALAGLALGDPDGDDIDPTVTSIFKVGGKKPRMDNNASLRNNSRCTCSTVEIA